MADVFARVLYGVALLIFIVDIVGAILWHKGSGFGYDSTYVTIENSGISTNRHHHAAHEGADGFFANESASAQQAAHDHRRFHCSRRRCLHAQAHRC